MPRIDSHHSFSERYPLEHLESILKRNRFEGSVLVGELRETPDFVKGIVVPVEKLDWETARRHPKFKGVMVGRTPWSARGPLAPLFTRSFPLDVLGNLAEVPVLAAENPELRICIVHLGSPPFDEWAQLIEESAQFPNVYCKLSGLTMIQPSPQPYVRHALSLFGPRRLMFGSDWPHSLPDLAWKANLAAFTQSIGAQPIEVREELLGGTAERFYGL